MQHLIATYGLLAVWVLMAAESACIPVPSEVTMLFAGALAAGAVSGPHPSLTAVIVAGTLGNVVGSYLAWLVGKYGGRPGLRRWGRYVGLRTSRDRQSSRLVRSMWGIGGVLVAAVARHQNVHLAARRHSRNACSAIRPLHRRRLPALDRGAGHRRIPHRRELADDRTRDAPSQPRYRGGGLHGTRHLGLTRHPP